MDMINYLTNLVEEKDKEIKRLENFEKIVKTYSEKSDTFKLYTLYYMMCTVLQSELIDKCKYTEEQIVDILKGAGIYD